MAFTSLDLEQCYTTATLHLQARRSSDHAVSSAASRGNALWGKCQTCWKVMGCKVFCFVGLLPLFPVCFQRRTQRKEVVLCQLGWWPKSPNVTHHMQNVSKLFMLCVPNHQRAATERLLRGKLANSDTHKKNWFCCLILSCRLWAVSPLSRRGLSTPRLPSIPGLFLCGRQHPASGCLKLWTSLQRVAAEWGWGHDDWKSSATASGAHEKENNKL